MNTDTKRATRLTGRQMIDAAIEAANTGTPDNTLMIFIATTDSDVSLDRSLAKAREAVRQGQSVLLRVMTPEELE